MNGLSERQQRFCDLVAAGTPAGRAYEQAGYRSKGAAADAQASRMLRFDKVAARIAELRADSAERAGITRERILEFLSEVIESAEERTSDRLKAAENLSKMCGWNEPKKIEVKTENPLMALLAEIRMRREIAP